jgi:hypothetical protein
MEALTDVPSVEWVERTLMATTNRSKGLGSRAMDHLVDSGGELILPRAQEHLATIEHAWRCPGRRMRSSKHWIGHLEQEVH